MTGNTFSLHSHEDQTSREYFHHSSAPRVNTNAALVEALRRQYPSLHLTVAPQGTLNLLAYTSSGNAIATPIQDSVNDPVYGAGLSIRSYIPPARRLGNGPGFLAEEVLFGKFLYKWKGHEFILYIANGRDGSGYYPDVTYHYILTNETHKVDELLKEATLWGDELHNEVWVFDQGYWQKSRELWEAVQKSRWEDVILEEGMKKAIIADVEHFFDAQETYAKLRVPWKRGIIYYGPPGNGKTISIKAMMHSLYQRGQSNTKLSVPTLYVRTLASFAGPEYSLRSIFTKARETAPCYLVFEDLDSIVNDQVRSYFLNEVDGLKSNDGILMVGSTNHLDRLDPGISKRPSRFDRKYFFPNPDFDQRVAYAKFWQGKLKDNEDIEFPDELCPAIARITDKFSFAYMQEAFIASLLAIAVSGDDGNASGYPEYAGPQDPVRDAAASVRRSEQPYTDLDDLVLWKEIQVQVKILREEIGEESRKSVTLEGGSGVQCQQSILDPSKTQQKAAGKKPEQTTASRSLFAEFEAWKADLMPPTGTKLPPPSRNIAEEKPQRDAQNMAQLIKVMDSMDTRTTGYAPKPPANLRLPSELEPLSGFYGPVINVKTGEKIEATMCSSNLPVFEEGAREAKFGIADWKPRNALRENMVELPARPLQQRVTSQKVYGAVAAQPAQIPVDRSRGGFGNVFYAPPNPMPGAYPPPTTVQAPLGKRPSLDVGQTPLNEPYSGFGQNWPSKAPQ